MGILPEETAMGCRSGKALDTVHGNLMENSQAWRGIERAPTFLDLFFAF